MPLLAKHGKFLAILWSISMGALMQRSNHIQWIIAIAWREARMLFYRTQFGHWIHYFAANCTDWLEVDSPNLFQFTDELQKQFSLLRYNFQAIDCLLLIKSNLFISSYTKVSINADKWNHIQFTQIVAQEHCDCIKNDDVCFHLNIFSKWNLELIIGIENSNPNRKKLQIEVNKNRINQIAFGLQCIDRHFFWNFVYHNLSSASILMGNLRNGDRFVRNLSFQSYTKKSIQ